MDQSEKNIYYSKKIGGFRPHFQGKPETFYTLSSFDICCSLFACFGVILLCFGLSIGLYFWSHNISTDNLITVWSIILLVFIPVFMIVAFCFSRGKAEVEQELIKAALDKQMHKKQSKDKDETIGVQKKDEYQLQNRDLASYTALQK